MMRINIMYEFNNAFIPYTGVSVESLLRSNTDAESVDIYFLIDGEFDMNEYAKLERTVSKHGRKCHLIDTKKLNDIMEKNGVLKFKQTRGPNYKLLVGYIFPEDVHYVLHLDSDTIVRKNLSPLFEKGTDKPLSMCYDPRGVEEMKERCRVRKEEPYYNGGVILYNMDLWRSQDCQRIVDEHYGKHGREMVVACQDTFSTAMKDKVSILPLKYNMQTHIAAHDPQLYMRFTKVAPFYGLDEIKDAIDDPVIVHMCRFHGVNPWHVNDVHPFNHYYDEYVEVSEWKGAKKTIPALPNKFNTITGYINRFNRRFLPVGPYLWIDVFMWRLQWKISTVFFANGTSASQSDGTRDT